MPFLFSHSKQPIAKSSISRPILQKASTINDYQGDKPLMQIPRTPPPPPVPRVPALRPTPVDHRTTTFTQIVDLYQQSVEQASTRSHFHEHLKSPTVSLLSSQWEDESMPSSSSSTLTLSPADKQNDDSRASAAERVTANSSPRAFPGGNAHAPIPFVLPSTHNAAQTQSYFQKRLPPPPPPQTMPHIPRTDALGRGLSQRYVATGAAAQQLPYSAAKSTSRPLDIRTRTDTRMQGRWLGLGTTRVDPKELRKQEKEATKTRERVGKEMRKAEKQMAKEAMKAGRK